MTWVEFTADFDWRVEHHTTVAYLAGMRCGVTTPTAEAAIAAGAAGPIGTPVREDAARLTADPFWRADDGDADAAEPAGDEGPGHLSEADQDPD